VKQRQRNYFQESFKKHARDYFYSLTDLNPGLMKPHDVSWFMKANMRNWIAEKTNPVAAKRTAIA
jgi:hypothetical protein